VTLTTERLRLEPWSAEHTSLLVRLSSLPEVTRFLGTGELWPRSRAEDLSSRQLAHWAEHGFGWRAAFDRASGDAVGLMALSFLGDGAPGLPPDEYELGWWLDPAVWGRGLAREGAVALRDEAFSRLGAPSVVARIQAANAASIAVATALGMVREREAIGRFGEPLLVFRAVATTAP
jgi:RimJ/RimL family protein N-acetyltransferase